MTTTQLAVLVLFGLALSANVGHGGIVRQARYDNPVKCLPEGHVYPGALLRGLLARNKGQCLTECSGEVGCQSMNVIQLGTEAVECELLSDVPTNYTQMELRENGTHYIKTDQLTVYLSALHGFTCKCDDGYIGNNCEIDIDECASNPCENGGTCNDGSNGYTCNCAAGSEGALCQTYIDECASNPCENDGTCTDEINGYTCNCAAGYGGAQCQTDIDECASNPCENSGTCTDGINGYTCNCTAGYWGAQCQTDCKEIQALHALQSTESTDGVYTVNPDGGDSIQVYCDMTNDGGGWTVIQRRVDDTVNFQRGWDEYQLGFGDLTGNFWLGLDHIHRLTTGGVELHVYLETFNDTSAFADYTSFSVEGADTEYRLTVSGYSGTAGDALFRHSGHRFSTTDNDNDANGQNCAEIYKGGWWYDSCHLSNPNGLYLAGNHESYADGINWGPYTGYHYSLRKVVMKIRRP